MTRKTDEKIGQMSLWTPAEMPTPDLVDLDIDPNRVITFSHLLKEVSDYMDLPASYATQASYELARPEIVHQGLYINREDSRSRTAENLYQGVIYPSNEFADISRSPSDLARHAKNRTRRSFKLEEVIIGGRSQEKVIDKEGNELNRDEIEARVERSAGHQLERYIGRLATRRSEMVEQHKALTALEKELRAPGRAHYKASNLNKLRVVGEQSIREAVEVASINMDWGSVTVDGLHQAVMYKIYGLPGHNNMRLRNFQPWAQLTHNWLKARGHGLNVSLRACNRELVRYQPALDAVKEENAIPEAT